MIRILVLHVPFTRSSVFTAERVARRGWMVLRNGGYVAQCDTEEEARDQAASYNMEVMNATQSAAAYSPVISVTGEDLQRRAAQDTADLFG